MRKYLGLFLVVLAVGCITQENPQPLPSADSMPISSGAPTTIAKDGVKTSLTGVMPAFVPPNPTIPYVDTSNCSMPCLAQRFSDKGKEYYLAKDGQKALAYFTEAQRIYLTLNDSKGILDCNSFMVNISKERIQH